MNYQAPSTVTESDREQWKIIATTLALISANPTFASDSSGKRTVHLVDPRSEVILLTVRMPDELYQRLDFKIEGQPPDSHPATYDALDPTDPNCKWFFFTGGPRWWEGVI